jgi:hypothetical protein
LEQRGINPATRPESPQDNFKNSFKSGTYND